MNKFFMRMKKWRINVGYSGRIIFVEVFTDIGKQIIIDVLEQSFNNFQTTIISQYVDVRYPDAGDILSKFVGNMSDENKIQVAKASSYTEFERPLDSAETYVLNVFGMLQPGLLNKIIRLRVLNISNILYGVRFIPENWQNDLFQWNKTVIKLFNLELESDSDEFVDLVNKVGQIVMTIDGNLFFCTTRVEYLTNLLKIIHSASNKYYHPLQMKLKHI